MFVLWTSCLWAKNIIICDRLRKTCTTVEWSRWRHRMKFHENSPPEMKSWLRPCCICSAGFTYRLYRLKPRVSRSTGGLQQTVVGLRIEQMAGIWSFRLNFVKNSCLIYYSQNLVSFNFRGDNAKSSNEFPWISIWRLVKPHANYRVDIPKARWLGLAFAESYRLLHVTLSKELVTIHVWNTPDQWHSWLVTGVRTAPCQAKCKNRAPT